MRITRFYNVQFGTVFVASLLFQTVAHAELKLPAIFGDNMVL